MTGSLMGYENNNDVSKNKKLLKPLPVVASVNAAGVTTSSTIGSNGGVPRNHHQHHHHHHHHHSKPVRYTSTRSSKSSSTSSPCGRGHVNSLWSCWYGIIAVGFQAYIAVRCTKRFIGKSWLRSTVGGFIILCERERWERECIARDFANFSHKPTSGKGEGW